MNKLHLGAVRFFSILFTGISIGGCASQAPSNEPDFRRIDSIRAQLGHSQVARRCGNAVELLASVSFPRTAYDEGYTAGDVVVGFSINKSGRLQNVRIEASTHSAFSEEVMRVLEQFRCEESERALYARLPVSFDLGLSKGAPTRSAAAVETVNPSDMTRMIWLSNIQAKVGARLAIPGGTPRDAAARFDVKLRASGVIDEARLVASSGVPSFDAAVERALLASSPLPVPNVGGIYDNTVGLVFRAERYRSALLPE